MTTIALDMVTATCPTCHMPHSFPRSLYDDLQRTKPNHTIYCPMGHRWHYNGENELDVELRKRQRAEQENARLAQEAASEARKRVAAEAKLKQHTKRTAAGLCPCCNRSFRQLKAHLKSKHPDYNVVPLKAS